MEQIPKFGRFSMEVSCFRVSLREDFEKRIAREHACTYRQMSGPAQAGFESEEAYVELQWQLYREPMIDRLRDELHAHIEARRVTALAGLLTVSKPLYRAYFEDVTGWQLGPDDLSMRTTLANWVRPISRYE